MDTQLRFLPWAVAFVVGAAAAADSPPTGVRACFAEKDPPRRLACYDTEVGKMIAGDGADQFGVEGALLQKRLKESTEPPRPHEITARVARVTHRPNGEVVVHLENDQIWEQSEDGPDLRIRAGDTVKIDRGMLGSSG